LLPTILLLRYFYARDSHPEPRRTLFVTFLLGILITVPVAIVESAIWQALLARHATAWGLALSMAFLLAAIPEEVFKFLVLRSYCARRPEFDEPMDGMVYGATVALASRRWRTSCLPCVVDCRWSSAGPSPPCPHTLFGEP
jgi:RsiW-degrading membrane proteinase PrsW (M82 family)